MNATDPEKKALYQYRISRVFRYIDQHLNENLSLVSVAEFAGYSPFHFHRIFKYITGETLNEYVTRKRIEKSAADLIHTDHSITDIGYTHGFDSNSSFSRAFKRYYGCSPGRFRKQNPHKFSPIQQLKSKNGQVYPGETQYIYTINHLKKWIQMQSKIEIKELPAMHLAYVDCIGSKNVAQAFQQLIQWAAPKGLLAEKAKLIRVFHDSFKITEEDKVRMSIGIVLNEPVADDGETGRMSINGGKFIVGRFEIGADEFEKSWTGLYVWMNENGYKKSGEDPFEIFHNNHEEHPEKKAIVDLCIPIK